MFGIIRTMRTQIIEVTQGVNHGKFLLARMDEEWGRSSHLGRISDVPDGHDRGSLLRRCGWGLHHLWVMDLQTGEGALFAPGPLNHASADLAKHRIWVCPLFEPFLTWLYLQDLSDLDDVPTAVLLDPTQAPAALSGYRRTGPTPSDPEDPTPEDAAADAAHDIRVQLGKRDAPTHRVLIRASRPDIGPEKWASWFGKHADETADRHAQEAARDHADPTYTARHRALAEMRSVLDDAEEKGIDITSAGGITNGRLTTFLDSASGRMHANSDLHPHYRAFYYLASEVHLAIEAGTGFTHLPFEVRDHRAQARPVMEPAADPPSSSTRWRIGNHYDVHVYEHDRPVATFHDAQDAARAVAAVNGATAAPALPDVGPVTREDSHTLRVDGVLLSVKGADAEDARQAAKHARWDAARWLAVAAKLDTEETEKATKESAQAAEARRQEERVEALARVMFLARFSASIDWETISDVARDAWRTTARAAIAFIEQEES